MEKELSYRQFLDKIEELKKKKGFDLSLDEDLSIAVMNLVSIEEHFYFTAQKTQKDEYLHLLREVREMRKVMLKKLISEHEGETWCISKHLLAASMRLMEVGTKLLTDKKEKEAKEMFDNAYKLYSLFWAMRMKLIDMSGMKAIEETKLNKHDQGGSKESWKYEDIINKLIDCCKE